jgi:diguanylate cyclase
LHFQPKADVRSGRFTAVEALVRWQHPTRGLLYPGAFLPAAEQTELVEPLTEWVLRTALATLPTLDPSGQLAVAVNISARSLTRSNFSDEVLAAIAASSVSPHRVILEVTETALMSDPLRAAATLGTLHEAGIRISIDDFGAGQTSLGYLAHLPVSELKIDKAFVLAMTSDLRNAAIVRSVIELGHSLGFTVTAEGVETPEVLAGLVEADCDLMQGFLLSRPVEASAVRKLLSADVVQLRR